MFLVRLIDIFGGVEFSFSEEVFVFANGEYGTRLAIEGEL